MWFPDILYCNANFHCVNSIIILEIRCDMIHETIKGIIISVRPKRYLPFSLMWITLYKATLCLSQRTIVSQ